MNSRWFSVMNISTAHVSEYAERFGSEYGLAEAFVAGRADAACDVHLALDRVAPHPLARVEIRFDAR